MDVVRGFMVPLVILVAGCGPSGPARVVPPAFDPAAVTRGLFEKADANRDGFLTAEELASIPGLQAAVAVLDADGDTRLSSSEITDWLQGIRDSRVAFGSAGMLITHKGRPVVGALVKLVPEPFMGSNIPEAEGRTDESGYASPSIPGTALPGASFGIYRVEITGNGVDGKPIPAKYNTETTLGFVVGALDLEADGPSFPLD